MPTERFRVLMRTGSALAVVLVLAACTAGGQFDPTEVVSGDIFNNKKRISGEREPVFPQGVPGAESGVPPDLVRGYQPPPEAPAPHTVRKKTAPIKSSQSCKGASVHCRNRISAQQRPKSSTSTKANSPQKAPSTQSSQASP